MADVVRIFHQEPHLKIEVSLVLGAEHKRNDDNHQIKLVPETSKEGIYTSSDDAVDRIGL